MVEARKYLSSIESAPLARPPARAPENPPLQQNMRVKVHKVDLNRLKSPLVLYRHPNPAYFGRLYAFGVGNALAFTGLAYMFYKGEKTGAGKGRFAEPQVMTALAGATAVLAYAAVAKMHRMAQTSIRSLVLLPPGPNGGANLVQLRSCALVRARHVTVPADAVQTRERLYTGFGDRGMDLQPSEPPSTLFGHVWAKLRQADSRSIRVYTPGGLEWRLDCAGEISNARVFDQLFFRGPI